MVQLKCIDKYNEGSIAREMETTFHDGRGTHSGENVLEHTVKLLDAAHKENTLVKLAIELHDIGKIHTRIEKEGKIMYIGHEKESHEMMRWIFASALKDELKLSKEDQDILLKVVLNHMQMNEIRWEYREDRFIRLYGRLNWDKKALRILLRLSYYDCHIEGADPLEEKMNAMIAREEQTRAAYSQHPEHKLVDSIVRYESEGRRYLSAILSNRWRAYCAKGLPPESISEHLHGDISNYSKFDEEKCYLLFTRQTGDNQTPI